MENYSFTRLGAYVGKAPYLLAKVQWRLPAPQARWLAVCHESIAHAMLLHADGGVKALIDGYAHPSLMQCFGPPHQYKIVIQVVIDLAAGGIIEKIDNNNSQHDSLEKSGYSILVTLEYTIATSGGCL
jgi:hypothetical protein